MDPLSGRIFRDPTGEDSIPMDLSPVHKAELLAFRLLNPEAPDSEIREFIQKAKVNNPGSRGGVVVGYRSDGSPIYASQLHGYDHRTGKIEISTHGFKGEDIASIRKKAKEILFRYRGVRVFNKSIGKEIQFPESSKTLKKSISGFRTKEDLSVIRLLPVIVEKATYDYSLNDRKERNNVSEFLYLNMQVKIDGNLYKTIVMVRKLTRNKAEIIEFYHHKVEGTVQLPDKHPDQSILQNSYPGPFLPGHNKDNIKKSFSQLQIHGAGEDNQRSDKHSGQSIHPERFPAPPDLPEHNSNNINKSFSQLQKSRRATKQLVTEHLGPVEPDSADGGHTRDGYPADDKDITRKSFSQPQSNDLHPILKGALLEARLLSSTLFPILKAKQPRKGPAKCKWCAKWEGTLVRVFPSEEEFQESEFYGGGDVVINDPHGAQFAVWPGKNNVERKSSDWWICTPVHPNCSHAWQSWEPPEASILDEETRAGLDAWREKWRAQGEEEAKEQRKEWRASLKEFRRKSHPIIQAAIDEIQDIIRIQKTKQ